MLRHNIHDVQILAVGGVSVHDPALAFHERSCGELQAYQTYTVWWFTSHWRTTRREYQWRLFSFPVHQRVMLAACSKRETVMLSQKRPPCVNRTMHNTTHIFSLDERLGLVILMISCDFMLEFEENQCGVLGMWFVKYVVCFCVKYILRMVGSWRTDFDYFPAISHERILMIFLSNWRPLPVNRIQM